MKFKIPLPQLKGELAKVAKWCRNRIARSEHNLGSSMPCNWIPRCSSGWSQLCRIIKNKLYFVIFLFVFVSKVFAPWLRFFYTYSISPAAFFFFAPPRDRLYVVFLTRTQNTNQRQILMKPRTFQNWANLICPKGDFPVRAFANRAPKTCMQGHYPSHHRCMKKT